MACGNQCSSGPSAGRISQPGDNSLPPACIADSWIIILSYMKGSGKAGEAGGALFPPVDFVGLVGLVVFFAGMLF